MSYTPVLSLQENGASYIHCVLFSTLVQEQNLSRCPPIMVSSPGAYFDGAMSSALIFLFSFLVLAGIPEIK